MTSTDITAYIVEGSKRKEDSGIFAGEETVELSCSYPGCAEVRRVRVSSLDDITEPPLCKGHAAVHNLEQGSNVGNRWMSEETIMALYPDMPIVEGSLRYDPDIQRQFVQIRCSKKGCNNVKEIQTQSLHQSPPLCAVHYVEKKREDTRRRVNALRERERKEGK